MGRQPPHLMCTVKAQAPAFSILLANSTVSLGVSRRRIFVLTGTDRFLLSVLENASIEVFTPVGFLKC